MGKRKQKSFTKTIQIVLFCMLALSILILISIFISKDTITKNIFKYRAQKRVLALEQFFSGVFDQLEIIEKWSKTDIIDFSSMNQTTAILTPVIDVSKDIIESLIILDTNKNHYLYGDNKFISEAKKKLDEEEWYTGAIENIGNGKLYWHQKRLTSINGNLIISKAFKDNNNKILVCAIAIKQDAYQNLLNSLKIGDKTKLFLLQENTVTLNLSTGEQTNTLEHKSDAILLQEALKRTEKVSDDQTVFFKSKKEKWACIRTKAFEDVDKPTITFLFMTPEIDLLLDSKLITTQVIIGLLTVLVIGITTSIFIIQKLKLYHAMLLEKSRHINDTPEELLNLIAKGENEKVEFKSTLRWNLRTNKADKVIENSALKTLIAYLNSDGGTLIIGVEDSGEIIGTEKDNFKNDDKFLLHFNNLIKERIGLEFSKFITFRIREISSSKIFVVDCVKSDRPAFLTFEHEEEFYIRVGPGSRKLPTSKAITYISRYKKKPTVWKRRK